MFKISEFSRLAQVPAKTLRYYAEIGLFLPAKVDPFTGYRYYTAEQLLDLNRILALKALGLSLEQIATLIREGLSVEQVKGMLRLKRSETLQTLQEEQKRLAWLDARLQQLENAGRPPDYEVIVKRVEALHVITLREAVPGLSAMGEAVSRMFGKLFGILQARGEPPTGAPLGLYHDEEMPEGDIDVEVAIPIATPFPIAGNVQIRTLPAQEVACTVHRGAFEQIGNAYQGVLWWLQANGYTTHPPSREVYLQYGATPAENLTELQYAFAPRNEPD
jgi:DNA-binding transcriptional MerR regulator